MTIRIHAEMDQGSDEWFAARCGMLTASEMKLIITPSLKAASNDKERAHLFELLAQRINKHVEPRYISDDMLRGRDDEIEAFRLYDEHFARAERVGFITNDKWGFTLGYSPDGLVGSDGQIECKSRRQRFQVETFILNVASGSIPADFAIQIQTGLLVSERAWCDLISFSGGMPLAVIRAYPDEQIQAAILAAASAFEDRIAKAQEAFFAVLGTIPCIPTERRTIEEITL